VVPLSETEVKNVKAGEAASVALTALPGRRFAAHVIAVSGSATTSSSGLVTYDVTFQLDQNSGLLRPGMTAEATIVVAQVNDATTVQNDAITTTGGRSTVTVLAGGREQTRSVVLGLQGGSSTQILSGVEPGDQVVVTALRSGG
jgi:hypothetical protein